MQKTLIINGGEKKYRPDGTLTQVITDSNNEFFTPENDIKIKGTIVSDPYQVSAEISKFQWADIIVYYFPVWWIYIPFSLKECLDNVLTAVLKNCK